MKNSFPGGFFLPGVKIESGYDYEIAAEIFTAPGEEKIGVHTREVEKYSESSVPAWAQHEVEGEMTACFASYEAIYCFLRPRIKFEKFRERMVRGESLECAIGASDSAEGKIVTPLGTKSMMELAAAARKTVNAIEMDAKDAISNRGVSGASLYGFFCTQAVAHGICGGIA